MTCAPLDPKYAIGLLAMRFIRDWDDAINYVRIEQLQEDPYDIVAKDFSSDLVDYLGLSSISSQCFVHGVIPSSHIVNSLMDYVNRIITTAIGIRKICTCEENHNTKSFDDCSCFVCAASRVYEAMTPGQRYEVDKAKALAQLAVELEIHHPNMGTA